MGKLSYTKEFTGTYVYPSRIYKVKSMYEYDGLKEIFINLRANIVDLNPALITKHIKFVF